MTSVDWFWLILDTALIGWMAWLASRPLPMPGDGVVRGPASGEIEEE